ncbi:hypothetical protein T492DRAFT_961483 [Pavlovales sp. CCMP2436]|nr:hypothetical protein T492DRAFT_961483 [Pavlovales sp. CCMP2436]|mmetsp:Transcript_32790/g.81445  ORF Transcript_32790/g.81445 Transcript_32790/m.81445 type:complete len:312 (+) Transcript_32790:3-938(+)
MAAAAWVKPSRIVLQAQQARRGVDAALSIAWRQQSMVAPLRPPLVQAVRAVQRFYRSPSAMAGYAGFSTLGNAPSGRATCTPRAARCAGFSTTGNTPSGRAVCTPLAPRYAAFSTMGTAPSGRAICTPQEMFAQMSTYRSVLAVCVLRGRVGFALSDHYMFTAAPLLSDTDVEAAVEAISAVAAEHPVGALAFAAPLLIGCEGGLTASPEDLDARAALLQALRSRAPTHIASLPCALLDADIRATDIEELARENPEMCEALLGLDFTKEQLGPPLARDGEVETPPLASLHAAAALSSTLWTHCEGWRNSFG